MYRWLSTLRQLRELPGESPTAPCGRCLDPIRRSPASVKLGRAWFCSRTCALHHTHVVRHCDGCGRACLLHWIPQHYPHPSNCYAAACKCGRGVTWNPPADFPTAGEQR